MITNQALVSSKPTVFSLLICCLVIVVVGLGNVIGQETKSVKKSVGSSMKFPLKSSALLAFAPFLVQMIGLKLL
jgi:hypothetical protein